MKLNKYMHPRNRYKIRPNFKEMAKRDEEFAKYCTIDLEGKVHYDFKNKNAVVYLCTILLKSDFGLDVTIPLETLTPAVPLRLNYILWLEDIFNECYEKPKLLSGIDIGTGAACIFPLLIAKKNHWKMLATDISKKSVKLAIENVNQNSLQDLIKVKQVDRSCYLIDAINNEEYDFCMCNPPFFSSKEELNMESKSRTDHRKPSNNCPTGTLDEVVSPGGEMEFVKHIISESIHLKHQIKIYTVMLGHKHSVKMLTKELNTISGIAVAMAQFFQGRTLRWGLAWSFVFGSLKSFLPLKDDIKDAKGINMNFVTRYDNDKCFEVLAQLLINLKIQCKLIRERTLNKYGWNLCAYENTWSNQRQKRRALQFKDRSHLSSESNELTSDFSKNRENVGCSFNQTNGRQHNMSVDTDLEIPGSQMDTCDSCNNIQSSSCFKRGRESDDSEPEECNIKIRRISKEKETREPLIQMNLLVNFDEEHHIVMLKSIPLSGDKNLAHQILQYIKNKMVTSTTC